MDQYYNNYNSFFNGPSTRSDDQTTDSYQSPDVFLNLEEQKHQPKIEEQDFVQKQEYSSDQNNGDEKLFETPRFDLINFEQPNNLMPMPIQSQKRSMKLKKEKAKNLAKRKTQNFMKSEQYMKSEQDTDSTNEIVAESDVIPQSLSSIKMGSSIDIDSNRPDKNMLQKIRNRISAQNSRDRKKAYITDLEAKNREILNDNEILKDRIKQIMRENHDKHRENQQLKSELTKLQKKYGEEKVSDNYFEDPHVQCQTPSTRRTGNANFGAIGLALFSLVSLIMVTNINVKDGNSVTLFNNNNSNNDQKTDLDAQLQLQQNMEGEFQQLDKESEEYAELKEIVECPELELKSVPEFNKKLTKQLKIAQIKQEQEEQSLNNLEGESKSLVSINKKLVEQKQNLRANCENCDQGLTTIQEAMVHQQAHLNSVQTIYCPQPYKYIHDISDSGVKMNFKNQEWLQLIIPTNELNMFSSEVDNIFVQRNTSDSTQKSEKKVVEVWAKVQSVRDVTQEIKTV